MLVTLLFQWASHSFNNMDAELHPVPGVKDEVLNVKGEVLVP